MKRKNRILLFLFSISILFINGCGASATAQNTQDTKTEETALTDTNAQTDSGTQTDDLQTEDSRQAFTAEDATPAVNTSGTAAKEDAKTASLPADYGEQRSIMGIITDAATYSLAIQNPEGETFFLTIPDSGVTGNLSYLTVGQIATLTYTGMLDENHAALVDISDSSIVTGIYVEEYAFAIKIINAVRNMDMEALSNLSNFPLFIDTGNYNGVINTPGEFEAIDNEKIFTEDLVERIANYNLFDLSYSGAGFMMGSGGPNITFDVDDDGILGIIGITCVKPAPPKEETKAKEDTNDK